MSVYDLSFIETAARRKKQLVKTEWFISAIIFIVEYFLYIVSFLILYQWRVSNEFQILQMGTWLESESFIPDYVFLFLLIHLIFSILLMDKKMFSLYRESHFVDDLFSIIRVAITSLIVALGVLFILKTTIVYSRVLIIGFTASIIIISTGFRAIRVMVAQLLSKNSEYAKNVLVVGAGKVGLEVADFFKKKKVLGYCVVGFLDDKKKGTHVIGTLQDLEDVINTKNIDEIIITIPSERSIINQLLSTIRKYDIEIKIIPEMFDFVVTTVKLDKYNAFPYMKIVKTPIRGLNLIVKRAVDILFSLIGLLFIFPLFIIVGMWIKLDSKGPIFFKQKRVGKNGVPFNMYKFRSMVTNAEELKEKLMSKNEAKGPVFKMKDDPRITKIGKFIRKYSIDELPQLLNVLKGEMSLIGPRPPLLNEVQQYDDYQWRRLGIAPGITGLWQVSGRSDLNFSEWVALDVFYIENWSIVLDIKIILRTIPVVLFGKGAY